MANKDKEVDDIFKDFKFKDDEESSHHEVKKQAQKDFNKGKFGGSEEKYQEEIDDLKEEMEELKEQVKGSKGKHKAKHIHHEPRVKHFSKTKSVPPERVVLIGIIVVLAAFIVIDLSFFDHVSKVRKTTDKETAGIVVVNESEQNETVEEEVIEEVVEEETEAEEEALSGKITFKIDEINKKVRADLGEDKGEISSITFTIDNGKNEVLTPVVEVYIYDSESEEVYETKWRGHYTYLKGIGEGEEHTATISITPKIFSDLDLKKHIRLTLNDTEDGFITAVNDDISIS